jgi:hypothetical protein
MVAPVVPAPRAIGLDVGGTRILSELVDRVMPAPGRSAGPALVGLETLDGLR